MDTRRRSTDACWQFPRTYVCVPGAGETFPRLIDEDPARLDELWVAKETSDEEDRTMDPERRARILAEAQTFMSAEALRETAG